MPMAIGVQATEPQRRGFAESLIRQAEWVIPGLSQHILVKEAATPVTIARYTLNRGGASMGWDQTPKDAIKPATALVGQKGEVCSTRNLKVSRHK